ncbi:unnamed protein product [Gadus morhua 'NCC']
MFLTTIDRRGESYEPVSTDLHSARRTSKIRTLGHLPRPIQRAEPGHLAPEAEESIPRGSFTISSPPGRPREPGAEAANPAVLGPVEQVVEASVPVEAAAGELASTVGDIAPLTPILPLSRSLSSPSGP